MSQQPTQPEEKTKEQTADKEPLWFGLHRQKLEEGKIERNEEESARAFYKPELEKLAELDQDEQDLANLPPPENLSETQKRKAEAARIQRERDEILEALKRDDAYHILFGSAEPREYDHQSRDVAEGSQLSFYKNGDYWSLGIKGQEVPLKHMKGLESIHFLLEHPNREIASSDVYHCGSQPSEEDTMPKHLARGADKVYRYRPPTKEDTDTVSESSVKFADARALKAAKMEIAKSKEQIAKIEENPTGNAEEDLISKEALREEISKLKEYISNTTRPGGGIRLFDSPSEKARKNVQKNIRHALKRIKDDCPDLEPFLNNETIRTGKRCFYSPDPENTPEWILHKPTH
jgi:hypothetical protein